MIQPLGMMQGLEPFPGYRLDRFLGRGGWGEVWDAVNPKGRRVALKFLPCANGSAAAQEVRSLQAIRQVEHPHLLRIDRVWCFDGNIVVAMELAEGSLLDLFEGCRNEGRTGLEPEYCCYFLAQAAQAIDFLNSRQHQIEGQKVAIRHCDIKPSNLLLLGETLKVADFSLATMTTCDMGFHRRAGTLDYAAQEVFQGRLSERTDQFALAVTYCVLRGGRLPFKDTPKSFRSNYVRPTPDLSMLHPREWPIVSRALLAAPHHRWSNCIEFVCRLTDALHHA